MTLLLGTSLAVGLLPILLVLLVVFGRDQPDPTGQRPFAIYLFVVCFLAVFVGLSALHGAANGAAQAGLRPAPLNDTGETIAVGNGFLGQPGNDGLERRPGTRQAVQQGIVLLVAGAVLAFHLRHVLTLVGGEEIGPAILRPYQVFLYGVCLVAIGVALFSGASALYAMVRVAAPDVFTRFEGESDRGGVQFLANAATAVAALVVFRQAWNATDERKRFWASRPPEDDDDEDEGWA